MLPVPIVVALAVGVVITGLLFGGARALTAHTWGRVVLLVGIGALPLLLSSASLSYGVHESSRTRFCLSCHEMKPYGASLFVDDRKALPAVHYQNRLIDREAICYSCHKDYAMFGDVKAKLNGLRHVWAHYMKPPPTKIDLYEPFPNRNCLHCHDDACRFAEAPQHKVNLEALAAERMSCLSCHDRKHDLAAVAAGKLWSGQ